MSRPSAGSDVKLPDHEESIAPVTILDAQGRLVRVVAAKDFRRTPAAGVALAGRIPPTLGRPRSRRGPPWSRTDAGRPPPPPSSYPRPSRRLGGWRAAPPS